MTKREGQLFRIDKRISHSLLSTFHPDNLTDHDKGETWLAAGDIGMFVREFRCPVDSEAAPRLVRDEEEEWVFEVYLFGDKLLQIEQYHASNILKLVKI